MKYIEAPDNFTGSEPSLFLAGGITGTANWQKDVLLPLLADSHWTILNPRREFFLDTPTAAREQIEWEYAHLRRATARLFWFPPETLCPMSLFELGAWSGSSDPLFVGVHPDYRRRRDIEIQLSLARPDVNIVTTLSELAAQTVQHLRGRQ